MKRLLTILAIVLSISMVLTACGGGSPPVAPETSANAETSPSTETTPEPPAETATPDDEEVESGASLVYWSMWSESEPQAIAIAEAAKAFESAYGVKVNINFNGRQLQREGLEPALSAGQAIDLFDEDIDRVSGTWGAYLLPLDNFVNDAYSNTDGQPYINLVNSALMNLAREKGNGSITVVPYQPFLFTTMYNKSLFANAGISGTPATWDAFLDVCAKLKDSGVTPMTVDNAYIPALMGYTLSRIVGADKCAQMVSNLDFSDPGVLRACQIWEDMIAKGYMSSKAATNVYPEGQAGEFAPENVAIYLNGTWLPNELKELNPNIQWGSFAWPAIDSTGNGTEANNIGGQSYGINKDTQYPKAAFAFIRWMTLGTYDQKLASDSLGVPMANDASWPAQLAEAKAVFDITTKPFVWAASMENDSNVAAALIEGFQKMVAGSFTAQQYADSLAALG